jgi:hypothetical protein
MMSDELWFLAPVPLAYNFTYSCYYIEGLILVANRRGSLQYVLPAAVVEFILTLNRYAVPIH